MLPNIFGKVPFLVIDQLDSFEDLIQSGFYIIPKITFTNLCKPMHGVIIIPVSSDPLYLENVKRKKIKRQFNISIKKEIFR